MNRDDTKKVTESLVLEGKTTGRYALRAIRECFSAESLEYLVLTDLLSGSKASGIRDVIINFSKGGKRVEA